MAEEPVTPYFYEPPDLGPGVYANQLSVWHTAHEFTMDFGVREQQGESDPGPPTRIVARLKVPPTKLFGILKALNGAMTSYEEEFGEIRQLDDE